jgi:hypothetical protein
MTVEISNGGPHSAAWGEISDQQLRQFETAMVRQYTRAIVDSRPPGETMPFVEAKASVVKYDGNPVVRVDSFVNSEIIAVQFSGIMSGHEILVLCNPDVPGAFDFQGSECEKKVGESFVKSTSVGHVNND